MKAVCILLCAALVHNGAASIFGRNYLPQMDSLVVQRDYINPQQQQKHQGKQHKQHYHHNPDYVHSDDSSSHEEAAYITKHISKYAGPWEPTFSANYPAPTTYFGDVITWKDVQIAAGPNSPVTNKKQIERIFQDAYDTMKPITPEEKAKIYAAYETAAEDQQIAEESQLNATQLLQKYDYQVEEHTIKTDDGYFLTLFQIAGKQLVHETQRPIVFLMHGLLGSADDWLVMGPKKSLAYILADAGYEVWLGNSRGSKYARRHVSKNAAQSDFWQFSIDEIALHDLPAMIDFALRTSNQEKLHYVGYSLGTTAFFALVSARPQYNDKIISMSALAPMVYMSATRSPLLRMIAPTSPFYELLKEQLGEGEFAPSAEVIRTVGGDMLAKQIGSNNVSVNVRQVMSGASASAMAARGETAAAARLGGAAVRTVQQYAQAAAAHTLRHYDFGARVNRAVYGSSVPPQYDMTTVRVPVLLIYSSADWLATPQDVARLATDLPSVSEVYEVPEPYYSHMDFLFNERAPQLVYQKLIDSIQKNRV